jgi:hypothetical protein
VASLGAGELVFVELASCGAELVCGRRCEPWRWSSGLQTGAVVIDAARGRWRIPAGGNLSSWNGHPCLLASDRSPRAEPADYPSAAARRRVRHRRQAARRKFSDDAQRDSSAPVYSLALPGNCRPGPRPGALRTPPSRETMRAAPECLTTVPRIRDTCRTGQRVSVKIAPGQYPVSGHAKGVFHDMGVPWPARSAEESRNRGHRFPNSQLPGIAEATGLAHEHRTA